MPPTGKFATPAKRTNEHDVDGQSTVCDERAIGLQQSASTPPRKVRRKGSAEAPPQPETPQQASHSKLQR